MRTNQSTPFSVTMFAVAMALPSIVWSDPPPSIAGRFVGPRAIEVEGRFFPPQTRVVLTIDRAEPHASVACLAEWRFQAQVDARGRLLARAPSPRGACAFACPRGDERMLVSVQLADQRVVSTLVGCARR